jgi:hypothetical protein
MPIPIRSGPYKTFRPLIQEETFVEFEGSIITIPLTARLERSNGQIEEKTEDIKLMAFMRLEVHPAYFNNLGTREFQFTIRDWDLFGYSPLLNELFYGNRRGGSPLRKGGHRRQAVMTFEVSHHYEKNDDENNEVMASSRHLTVENITSHDSCNGCLFWQVRPSKTKRGTWSVCFHNKPNRDGIKELKPFSLEEEEDDIHLLAMIDGIEGGQEFVATLGEEYFATLNPKEHSEEIPGRRITAWSEGNTVVSKIVNLRTPMTIKWRLGKSPREASGTVRVVSPSRSICTAEQGPSLGEAHDSCDFPARIVYAANYHVSINKERFIEDQSGVAIACGVHEIPPRDVTVAFDKPHAGYVLGKYIKFGNGHCTGMHEITEVAYRKGLAVCKFWRNQPL